MAYATIKYGSSGSAVKELQKKLNENGYNLAVDGRFGSATRSAVKDYQKKQGLAVDGIVGKNTWGSLLGTTVPGGSTGTTGKQVLSGVSDETSDRLAALEPLMLEALPLSLEEIFIYELGGEQYAVKEIIL